MLMGYKLCSRLKIRRWGMVWQWTKWKESEKENSGPAKEDKVGTKRPWIMNSLLDISGVYGSFKVELGLTLGKWTQYPEGQPRWKVPGLVVSCPSHHPTSQHKCLTPPNYIHHMAFYFLFRALPCWVQQFTLEGAGNSNAGGQEL